MIQSPIFILGAHKSGTTLVRSILDGHSSVFAIPFEPHPFQQLQYWIDNEYRKQSPGNLNRSNFLNACCQWIHHCNTTEDRMGDNFVKGRIDESQFKQVMESKLKSNHDNPAEWLSVYYEAIHHSLHHEELPDNRQVVDKSVENAEFAWELSQFFPDATFLHVLRNPYANLVSLRRYKSRNFGYPVLSRVFRTLYNSYYFLYKNQRLISNYHILHYENLVTTPEKVIQRLCSICDIEWEDILTSPTLNGESWQGNSTRDRQFSGISSSHLESWKQEIHPVETFYMNYLFPFLLDDYNYDQFEAHGSFWKKVPGENLKRYIANRLYRFYLIED